MLSPERREEAARTLLRLAGRDHHDDGAVQMVLELSSHRLRLMRLADARRANDHADLLRALNDLNPRARS